MIASENRSYSVSLTKDVGRSGPGETSTILIMFGTPLTINLLFLYTHPYTNTGTHRQWVLLSKNISFRDSADLS